MMVRVYAAETEKTDMRVNAVDPGIVDTAMLREAFPGGYQGDMKRPEDVASAFVALADLACAQNGEVLRA